MGFYLNQKITIAINIWWLMFDDMGEGVLMKILLIMLSWREGSKNLVCFELKARYTLNF